MRTDDDSDLGEYPSMTMTRTYCGDCGFVLGVAVGAGPRRQCPNCGSMETLLLWPDVSALTLLDMVLYFDRRAGSRDEDARARLAARASEILGREITPAVATSVALDAQRIYNDAGESAWEQRVADEMLEAVRSGLGLATREEALAVWAELGQYSDSVEEHKVVVILASTYLERLFGDVLIVLGVTNGMKWSQAERKIEDDIQSMPRREEFFQQHAQVSLTDALAACAHASFSDDWKALRRSRNKFIHGFPWAINGATARLAVKLSLEAIPVFADLQNTHCVRKP